MYHLLPIRRAIIWFFLLCLVFFLIAAHFSKPEGWLEPLKLGSLVVAGMTGLVLFFGESRAFPWVIKYTPLKTLFPYIEGEWAVLIQSNWKKVREINDLADNEEQTSDPKTAKATIKARLFSVTLLLETDDKYSESETIFAIPERNKKNGNTRLHYIYHNETRNPEETDCSRHYGAAYLDTKAPSTMPKRLEGVYWTNRSWHKGLNTAGSISFHRE